MLLKLQTIINDSRISVSTEDNQRLLDFRLVCSSVSKRNTKTVAMFVNLLGVRKTEAPDPCECTHVR